MDENGFRAYLPGDIVDRKMRNFSAGAIISNEIRRGWFSDALQMLEVSSSHLPMERLLSTLTYYDKAIFVSPSFPPIFDIRLPLESSVYVQEKDLFPVIIPLHGKVEMGSVRGRDEKSLNFRGEIAENYARALRSMHQALLYRKGARWTLHSSEDVTMEALWGGNAHAIELSIFGRLPKIEEVSDQEKFLRWREQNRDLRRRVMGAMKDLVHTLETSENIIDDFSRALFEVDRLLVGVKGTIGSNALRVSYGGSAFSFCLKNPFRNPLKALWEALSRAGVLEYGFTKLGCEQGAIAIGIGAGSALVEMRSIDVEAIRFPMTAPLAAYGRMVNASRSALQAKFSEF